MQKLPYSCREEGITTFLVHGLKMHWSNEVPSGTQEFL